MHVLAGGRDCEDRARGCPAACWSPGMFPGEWPHLVRQALSPCLGLEAVTQSRLRLWTKV